jgi:Spy/CpxP family protein refolding chaperone
MARQFAWILAVTLVATPAVAAAETLCDTSAQAGQRDEKKDSKQGDQRRPNSVKWWADTKYRAELGITDQQSSKIEQIFQQHIPAQRARYEELRRLEPALAKLIKEGAVDPSVIEREVDRVESLMAETRKARIIVLYRMERELTVDQRTRLKAMHDRREAERGKSDASRRQ